MKRDTSDLYTPERGLAEDVEWIKSGIYRKHAAFLLPLMTEHSIKTILEYGCGSGLLANILPGEVEYTGIDRNTWMLDQARKRNNLPQPFRRFVCWDARNWKDTPRDLALAFQFLKNFSLEEFDTILAGLFAAGKHAAFDVEVYKSDLDNGTDYHNVFVNEEHLGRVIASSGHKEVARQELSSWPFMGDTARCVAIWTTRVGELPTTPGEGPGVEEVRGDHATG